MDAPSHTMGQNLLSSEARPVCALLPDPTLLHSVPLGCSCSKLPCRVAPPQMFLWYLLSWLFSHSDLCRAENSSESYLFLNKEMSTRSSVLVTNQGASDATLTAYRETLNRKEEDAVCLKLEQTDYSAYLLPGGLIWLRQCLPGTASLTSPPHPCKPDISMP